MNDTIAAISTALGVGAISIIRVSGPDSINIVNKITKFKKLLTYKTHTINYDYIVDENNNIVDEVLISIMKKPKTFTKENIVEINCHGGIATTNKILELVLTNGARLALKGEFSKRAFLNGRIDLVEAEGIMDLINAKTDKSLKLAINQVSGKVSKLITDLRQKIIEILANIEVNIDYPEYEDIEEVTNELLSKNIKIIKSELQNILDKSKNGKILKDGINVALIGKPNVGKSSLLNALLEQSKAIVTDIAGTTRDFVEGSINLDGIILNFIDTAGIRKTDDVVEKIGVEKSLDLINNSDLVLFLLNNNEKITNEDKELLEKIKKYPYIIVINKIDLDEKLEINDNNIVKISALNNLGIDKLKDKIKEIFNLEQIETEDLTYLSNARCISLLKQALNSTLDVEEAIKQNMPVDIIEIDLKNIWEILGSIIGVNYDTELIDQLFSQFCLGK